MEKQMTYESTGVNYADMDPFKIACQKRATLTSKNAKRLGFDSFEWTRGESAYLFDTDGAYQIFAHVEEGLGTKNLVADAMMKITGKSHYDHVAKCTIAMIVNDMITLGAFPVSLAMHLAVGSSDWFKNEERVSDLIKGWGDACDEAGCIWAGGETPTLKGIIYPEASLLSGSAVGVRTIFAPPMDPDSESIKNGDAIIFLESSGIHANGLTLARKIADNLPKGYETELSDGRMYGEALLDPTHIYVRFIEECINRDIWIHYAVNVTGHGWRKLMRAPQLFNYVIEKLPTQLPIFDFIQEHGPVSDEEAYGNLNMGAGFAMFVSPESVEKLSQIETNLKWFVAGYVEKSSTKRVVILPKGLEFKAETLAVR
ncbi:MAG TPA: AIR synthase related protein [Candidatus Paceibacterota bacterium]|nr:AIR synthase related protein [Candidatus Paceibacterota bacterium]